MPRAKVDGVEIDMPRGATVLQACELAGKKQRIAEHHKHAVGAAQ